jgi:putative N6-adenine-specific DNA methylase
MHGHGRHRRTGCQPKQVVTQVREGNPRRIRSGGGDLPRVDTEEPKVVRRRAPRAGSLHIVFRHGGQVPAQARLPRNGHPAPLKETLAAAILHFAGYDGTQPFLDPIVRQRQRSRSRAATIAVRKPPHIHRRKGEFHSRMAR